MYAKVAVLLAAFSAAVSAAPAAPAEELVARGASYSGDVTYYTPGVGSCGKTNSASDHIVALSPAQMQNGANPNANPKCGKNIQIHYGGKTFTAKIVDTCPGCASGSIDITPSLFTQMTGSLNAGRLHNVKWNFA